MGISVSRFGSLGVGLVVAASVFVGSVCSAHAKTLPPTQNEFIVRNNTGHTLVRNAYATFTTGSWAPTLRPPRSLAPFQEARILAYGDYDLKSQVSYSDADLISINRTDFIASASLRWMMESMHPLFQVDDVNSTLSVSLVAKDIQDHSTFLDLQVTSP